MKNPMAPNIALTIIVLAAVAAVALRAAARRPAPQGDVPGTELATATVTAVDSQPRVAAAAVTHDGAGRDLARPQAVPDRRAIAVEQAQPIFHELHADGRNALCAVCDSQYGSA